ncbi:MAG: hypothetical protein D6770_01780 [Anaerolineae bacterium]|nr:MAG: hypothetical protein D6770_01780 [Anaerolineae bacterium]
MAYRYLILGSGRQGTAAAYDLAKFGDADTITLADANPEAATRAAERINRLTGREVASPLTLDVTDASALRTALQGMDVALSAVPYYYNLGITKACIESNVSLCDMGGNTDVVWKQLELDSEARAAGVSIVPDCGMGPGLNVTMAAYAIDLLDQAHSVRIYDGGLPQNPIPPWNYVATFHINGLTNEMDGQAIFLRNGELTRVDTLTEPEFVDIPPLGRLEADVTSGGLSTSPWTFKGRLQEYSNKTLRYPGHFEWWRAFKALGLFSEEPLPINGQRVIPRQVFHALLEPKLRADEVRDICVMRVVGEGEKDGRPTRVVIDLVDRYDETTGFTAMERLTGWHCAIMMGFQARGHIGPGAHRMESAVPAAGVMEEIRRRGIEFTVQFE